MAIDASIALGVKPVQLESPINQMSNVYALQNAAQSNQLNQMKMEEYKRGLAESESFKRNMLGVDASTPEGQQSIYNILLRAGRVDDATKFAKNIDETKNLRLAGKETESKLLKSALEQSQAALVNVRTPEQYLAWHEANHTHPIIGPYLSSMGVTKDSARADIEKKLALPGGLDELIRQSALGVEKNIEMSKPNMVARTDGKTNWLEDSNKFSPSFGQRVSSAKLLASPESELSAATQIRSQNLINARELQRIEIEKGKNSPEYIAMKSQMEEKGKGQAKFEAAAPQAIATAEQMLTKIDQMVGTQAKLDKKGKVIEAGTAAHPGFKGAVGKSSMYPLIPGTDAANFQARLDEIKGGAFLEAYNTLRGGGSITQIEGDKATAARTRMSTAQSEEEFIAAARDYQNIIRAGIKDAKEKLAKGNKTSTTTTPAGATVSNWQD